MTTNSIYLIFVLDYLFCSRKFIPWGKKPDQSSKSTFSIYELFFIFFPLVTEVEEDRRYFCYYKP